jgi:predicted TIM-barrel fold metal-dependent hydrolase
MSLGSVPLFDQHAHGILRTRPTLDEFRGLFSESTDPRQWPHVATSLSYRRAIRELAAFFELEPTERAVYEHRIASDPAEHASLLLKATNTETLLVDDGFPAAGEGTSWDELGELAGCAAYPVLRIERVAEEGLEELDDLDALGERLRGEIRAAREGGFVGLKTIAAYRTGLDVQPPDPQVANEALAGSGPRLVAKPLLDWCLWQALEANESADPLPVQVHVGFGDSDLFLPRARPGYLKPLVERFRETPFVLLHCYPFVREAGWLAHVYGNVFFDVSLTIPHVSRPAEMLRQALELAPVSKLLYASDAALTPELYYLAATWWRAALEEVLSDALPPAEVEEAGRLVLRESARRLYRIDERGG